MRLGTLSPHFESEIFPKASFSRTESEHDIVKKSVRDEISFKVRIIFADQSL